MAPSRSPFFPNCKAEVALQKPCLNHLDITVAANISIAEGEAAIFAPDGGEHFTLVARVLAADWAALVEASRRS